MLLENEGAAESGDGSLASDHASGNPADRRSSPSYDGLDDEPPPSSTLLAPPIPLEPRGNAPTPLVFRQGAHPPFGIRWYGITSLFGHLRNFVARAIATESVDSRDWMRPNPPDVLLFQALRVLRPDLLPSRSSGPATTGPHSGEPDSAGRPSFGTLVEALGRSVWIDFVADTGDDRDVSAQVGAMLGATYDVADRDGQRMLLPRGDVLVFGGDVSYPVATADEIFKRLVLPWNEQLRKVGASSKKRLLLGVPGNHDWYDGLDGFGRLFRRRIDEPFRADDRDTTPKLGKRLRKRPGRKVGLVARQLHLDEVGSAYGLLFSFGRSVAAFFRGVAIKRRRRLVLRGYEPVQEASYFVLPLAPGLDMWGADRQLGRIDFRQRAFFTKRKRSDPTRAVMFIAGDPAMAFGHRNDPGARMLSACRLNMDRDRVLYLAGDFHHYERRRVGSGSMHVIAGGGGAFLHGTRIAPYPAESGPPAAVYPDGPATRQLTLQVPLKLTVGRAGLLVHLALGIVASIELSAANEAASASASLITTAVLVTIGLGLALYFVAHQGHGKRLIAMIAVPFAIGIGLLPMGLRLAIPRLPFYVGESAILVVCAFVGTFLFGLYLTVLTLLGLEHQQSFTVLGHPGFKHFVRLCVHPDGKVEAWTIGKDDVLAEGSPRLIDRFEWEAKPNGQPPK